MNIWTVIWTVFTFCHLNNPLVIGSVIQKRPRIPKVGQRKYWTNPFYYIRIFLYLNFVIIIPNISWKSFQTFLYIKNIKSIQCMCIKKGNRTPASYCSWITLRMNDIFSHSERSCRLLAVEWYVLHAKWTEKLAITNPIKNV